MGAIRNGRLEMVKYLCGLQGVIVHCNKIRRIYVEAVRTCPSSYLDTEKYLYGLCIYRVWRRYQMKYRLTYRIFDNQMKLVSEIRSLPPMGVFPGWGDI